MGVGHAPHVLSDFSQAPLYGRGLNTASVAPSGAKAASLPAMLSPSSAGVPMSAPQPADGVEHRACQSHTGCWVIMATFPAAPAPRARTPPHARRRRRRDQLHQNRRVRARDIRAAARRDDVNTAFESVTLTAASSTWRRASRSAWSDRSPPAYPPAGWSGGVAAATRVVRRKKKKNTRGRGGTVSTPLALDRFLVRWTGRGPTCWPEESAREPLDTRGAGPLARRRPPCPSTVAVPSKLWSGDSHS